MNFPTSAMIGPRQLLATTDLDGLQISGIDGTNATRRYASLATAWSGATGPLASGAARGGVDLQGRRRDACRPWPTRRWPTRPQWNADAVRRAAGERGQADQGRPRHRRDRHRRRQLGPAHRLRQHRLGHDAAEHLRPRHRRSRPSSTTSARRRSRRHGGDDQRVRPTRRRERQPGLRPRLGQHDAGRRRRREGRSVLRQLARPATTSASTRTSRSPPTTATCSARSCRRRFPDRSVSSLFPASATTPSVSWSDMSG